jgi:hypothetical protein
MASPSKQIRGLLDSESETLGADSGGVLYSWSLEQAPGPSPPYANCKIL